MKKLVVASVLLVGVMFSKVCFASEVDSLVQSLVDKGVLTSGEARKIITETNEQTKEQLAEGTNPALPEWVQKLKIKGDFRLRYEWDKDKAQADYDRARIRVRFGLEAKVNQKLTMGIGIATGTTSDPRSRNITLGNSSTANTPGSAKDIVLDYAYASYMVADGVNFTGGKFQNPLWQVNDAFWKGDITPDGLALAINKKIGDVEFFANDLFFILKNDSRTDAGPFLNALQPGFKLNFNDKTAWKTAAAYYFFDHIKDQSAKFSYSKSGSSPYTTAGNTLVGGYYIYNYTAYQGTTELSSKEFLGGLLPYASVFGDYMYNPDPLQGNGGFDIGIKFGVEKVGDKGQWQGKLIYSKLGRDCWLDIFTDSDRYGGTTNSKADEAIFEYGLGKNTSLILDYYHSQSLTKDSLGYRPEQVLQIDWNMKF